MQLYSLLFLGIIFAASPSFAEEPYPSTYNPNGSEIKCKNEKRAIVTGSSVSLGFFGDSPAMLYLENAGYRFGCIRKKTVPFGHSAKMKGWLSLMVAEFKPDIIVAMDYLIHDVTFVRSADGVEEALRKTNETIDYLISTNIPVLIGSVFSPRVVQYPFHADLARAINRRLCDEMQRHPNTFYVLPISRIYDELYSNRFTVPGYSKLFKEEEVLVDMYHPGPRGAYLMINKTIDILNQYHRSRHFPLLVKPFPMDKVLKKPRTRAVLQAVNPFADNNLILIRGEDTLALVDENTIPADMGDQACFGR